jgi:hypothetical protein
MKKVFILLLLSAVMTAALFAQTSGEDLAVLNRMMKLKMDGLIPLRFANALDAKPIEGAVVNVYGIGTFITNMEGIISFPEQEDGFYTLEFSKQGYITSRIEFEVILNNVFNGRFSISPVMRGDYLRIVLDWGQHPGDLDLHLVKEGGYHVSYWDMHNSDDGSVTLDRDSRNGFGPETITIMETDLRAVYHIFIHDYTNRNRSSSTEMSRSGAAVRVFDRYGHLRSFYVPANRQGVRWDVFRIVNGQLVGTIN